jgi:hypothetical protein
LARLSVEELATIKLARASHGLLEFDRSAGKHNSDAMGLLDNTVVGLVELSPPNGPFISADPLALSSQDCRIWSALWGYRTDLCFFNVGRTLRIDDLAPVLSASNGRFDRCTLARRSHGKPVFAIASSAIQRLGNMKCETTTGTGQSLVRDVCLGWGINHVDLVFAARVMKPLALLLVRAGWRSLAVPCSGQFYNTERGSMFNHVPEAYLKAHLCEHRHSPMRASQT